MEEQQLILIVDPDPARRDGLAHPLIRQGYRVQVTADGATALEVARITRPQMVICARQALERDGATLYRGIRSDARLRFTHLLHVAERSEPFLHTDDDAAPDDLLFRPFLDMELETRVRLGLDRVALLRRVAPLRNVPTLRHELNNPLFAVSGSAESVLARLQILANGGISAAEDLIPRVERILAAAERIGQIVHSLGDLPATPSAPPFAAPEQPPLKKAA